MDTAIVSGLIVAAVLQFWFGSITSGRCRHGPADGRSAAGLWRHRLLPLVPMVMMFLGNPLAGIATTGAWLPGGLGISANCCPRATGALVRSAAYFNWAGSVEAAITLVVWIVVGTALTVWGMQRQKSSDKMLDLRKR